MHLFRAFLLLFLAIFSGCMFADQIRVPILTYHNFDPSKTGSMTISTQKFEQQINWLQDHGYHIIPLKDLVNYLRGDGSPPPAKSVVITVDDGRDTVYKYLLPIVQKYHFPVTLFIYPTAISNASYAMTWDQLRNLQATGLFDIQSHTYWHANFKQEKKKLSESAYEKLVQDQLVTSKKILDQKLDTNVTLLAWPFGIYDPYLEQQAAKAGYVMTFSIDGFPASKSVTRLTQPRYLIVEPISMKTFESFVTR